MKLGQIIEQYRLENSLSQRQFATRCGVSNGYVAMIERGKNPVTGKPIAPTLPALEKLAGGMSLTLDDLLRLMDDIPVDMQDTSIPVDLCPEEAHVLSVYRSLTAEGRKQFMVQLTMVANMFTDEKNNSVPISGTLK